MPADTSITWYGHGTWGHVTPGGVRILVDPWLGGNPSCPEQLKRPEQVDVILVTHGHGDHISDVKEVAARTGAQVLAKYEVATWLGGQGVENVTGFNTGGRVDARGVGFTMTNAVHSGGIVGPDGEITTYGGEPAGYVIHLENGANVYQAGDTAIHSDMALLADLYRPELAILPIGDLFTMGPFQAAHAVRLLGVQEVLGGHWGTFPALTGTPAGLREELGKLGLGNVTVHELAPGGPLQG
jgi:L-ascorbate metabolism protein UlaG (beta-lactamase superfamily)